MKLKDSVTIEQLEELGFKRTRTHLVYVVERHEFDEYPMFTIEVLYPSYKIIFGTCATTSNADYKASDILLKMFKLGYIEESENKNENN